MVVTERLSVINRSEDHSYEEALEAIVKEQNLMIEIGMLESHLNDEVISQLDNGTRRVEW
jgi:hypothetical protein